MTLVALNGELGRGLFIAIDDKFRSLVMEYKWYLSTLGSVVGYKRKNVKGEKPKPIILARLIKDFPQTDHVHHINENPLDNREANLLPVTQKEHGQLHKQLGSYTRKDRLSEEQWSKKLTDEL